MHRVIVAGGATLVRDAYAHIIDGSPTFTLQAQTPTFAEALTFLATTRSDILLIEAHELAGVPPVATQQSLRQAAARTRVVLLGNPPADLALLVGAGVTGILGLHLELDHFFTALDLVSRGGMVISPAPTHATSAPLSPPALASLSNRERQVLALVPTQPNNDAIARLLGLSPLTVKTHINRIRHKLGASSRAHLVAIAYESRLVTPGRTPHAPTGQ
ncbi:response regulator transcription factor [Streptomyces sp. NPDC056227]|uniref:response regulator transcription factor n=1 Tax=Streptomyces sp. NPDC056227 TaxID=3345753 RepID=UPI0035D5F644